MLFKQERLPSISLLIILALWSCQPSATGQTTSTEYYLSDSGLKSKTIIKGSGPEASKGDDLLIYETTTYVDGTVLYSNEKAEEPLKITLGANQVITGVEEGLEGMQSGEVKQLIVPPHLSKRTMYPDHISPDSTLYIKLIVDKVIKAE